MSATATPAALPSRPLDVRGGVHIERAAPLLTADELAARWQVGRAHVYRLAREGRVPSVRVGRYFRFRLAAIEAWEQEGGADA